MVEIDVMYIFANHFPTLVAKQAQKFSIYALYKSFGINDNNGIHGCCANHIYKIKCR